MRKMNKRIAWILLVILILSGISTARGETLTQEQLISFYEDSVFVGDSITRQFHTYMNEKKKTEPGFLFPVKYLTAQSYMLYTASRKNPTTRGTVLTYKGSEMPLCRILEKMKPRMAFILLGVNDYAGEQIEKHIGYCERIVELTAEFAPETKIVFFSLTPVTRSFCRKKDYRTMWDEYNKALEEKCAEMGAGFVDIATPLKDEEGYLPGEYSSDGQYHMNDKGLQIWFDCLMDYAQEQYDQGLWAPGEGK